MEQRTNRTPRLAEYPEGDFDGDFLGGIIMANHETLQARSLEQLSEGIPAEVLIIPRSTGINALERIGPDNFRGFPLSQVVFDASTTPEA